MTAAMPPVQTGLNTETLATLLDLGRQARIAQDSAELHFLAVNASHALAPYRQAALWHPREGILALSGVLQIEANAPYVLWLESVCQALSNRPGAFPVSAQDLAETQAQEWEEWLPAYGLWLPVEATKPDPQHSHDGGRFYGGLFYGGLLLARDYPWQEHDIAVLQEWIAIWQHAWQARHKPRLSAWWVSALRQRKQTRIAAFLLTCAVMVIPIRLNILAPGELVPAHPVVIRAPVDGVLGQFFVQPNDVVSAGQALFGFDEAHLSSRRDVALEALSTAQAEYRQAAQLAVNDNKYKAQLATLFGKTEEKRAEARYMEELLQRARVSAPQAGVALFDDPGEWIGKPVSTGERIMRIAATDDIEVEAWIPVADAIPLPVQASVNLYLSASPLESVRAQVRYVSHEAVARPDGSYAYRVRATLDGPIPHRVGLKGTARLNGEQVPLIYWIMRRPIAQLRQTLGL